MRLTVNNVSFSYKNGKPVFENVSMETGDGEIVAILGANGSGKTTFLKCLMGFLKFGSGDALIDGENISGMNPKKLWQKIAYVPQARGVYSTLDVRNMILLGCATRIGVFSSPSERDNERVDEIADRLGISHLLNKKCTEISGGELQMVLLSRALAAEPEILILDEPESNLDFRNQIIVLDTLSILAKEGMCVIFTTHYPDHAIMRADKSLLMCRERALFGKTKEIITEENIGRAFGVNAVISEIKKNGDSYLSVIPTGISDKKV